MSRRRVWLVAVVALVGCSSAGSNPDGAQDRAQDPCAPTYPGTLITSTIHGMGFDQWEGQAVDACLNPAQSFSMKCGSTHVAGGEFSLTESVCTAYLWTVTIGSGGQTITCSATGAGGEIALAPAMCSATP